MWKATRINYTFIFEFNSKTALRLRYRDAFLICTSLMTAVVGALVLHHILRSTGFSALQINVISAIFLLVFLALLICPFNVFYRSTRCSFLKVIRNIVFSPFYKVLMVDFFMADQLTSQIPLLRHMETTACYFFADSFKTHRYDVCKKGKLYREFPCELDLPIAAIGLASRQKQHEFPCELNLNTSLLFVVVHVGHQCYWMEKSNSCCGQTISLSYVISFAPYYWRAMQCARRWFDESDVKQLANLGKYVSAMVAAGARLTYSQQLEPTILSTILVVTTSVIATIYQLYWDFVQDWGFFDLNSKIPWLRNDLVLKNKCVYYLSIVLNLVLRVVWVESVLRFRKVGDIGGKFLEFSMASLEVIRRGHWNFYRLENEHLNNVGKFRAVKPVPLPFRETDSDGY